VAHERAVTKLRLRVLATNPRARRVYDRQGYAEEGRLVGEFMIDGQLVDDILMAKGLP